MRRITIAVVSTLLCTTASLAAYGQSDWLNWRGPNGNGIAASGQTPPIQWDTEKNVVWKTKVPGRGHASPTVVGDKILLGTADEAEKTQSVVCFDRATGKQLWQTVVNTGGFPKTIHRKNTHASQTLACDGERVFVVFNHHDAVTVNALDLKGNKIWEKEIGKYKPRFPFGFGTSPIIFESNVIVTSDNEADSAIVAYNTETGKENWRIDRPKFTSYSTPVITEIGGKTQMLISGGKKVHSYDPKTGDLNWESPARWFVSCGTIVWDKDLDLVFVSGGYPQGHTLALKASNGEKVWDNNIKCYEQSMICVDGYVYAFSEDGIAYCWKASDGTLMWKDRTKGPECASPVFAGGHIYHVCEAGRMFVVKPNPKKLQVVAENDLGDSAFASPSIVDSQIFYRVGDNSQDEYHEWLYCLGKKPAAPE